MPKKRAFPKVIRQGHTRATIYKTPYRNSDGFTIAWYEGEKRYRKLFNDLADAELHANAMVNNLSRGEARVVKLSGEHLLEYNRACEFVKEFGLALDTIAAEYRDAGSEKGPETRRTAADLEAQCGAALVLQLSSGGCEERGAGCFGSGGIARR